MASPLIEKSENLVKELNNIRTSTQFPPFRHLCVVLQTHHDNLRQLTSQKSENESVKAEFSVLESEGHIWKLTGPVLVKQDREDAVANVGKRLEFITTELVKAEEAIKATELTFEDKRQELMTLQSQIQSMNSTTVA